jgi:hypothetical protein
MSTARLAHPVFQLDLDRRLRILLRHVLPPKAGGLIRARITRFASDRAKSAHSLQRCGPVPNWSLCPVSLLRYQTAAQHGSTWIPMSTTREIRE